jgi:hypothetical protein
VGAKVYACLRRERDYSTDGKRMRDGWRIQGLLGFQSDLALEEDLVPHLVDALARTSQDNARSVCELLVAQRARAREQIMWLDLLTFPLPTVVYVAGGRAAGKSSFVADLVDGSAICTSDVDATTNSVYVRGYRSTGPVLRTAGHGQAVHVTSAEYVEQWQRNGPDLLPLRLCDRPSLSPIDRVLLIDGAVPNNACLKEASTQYGLGPPVIVFFLIDTNAGDAGVITSAYEEWLRRVRACMREAVIHIVLTKADLVSPGRLDANVTTCRHRFRDLINGQVLVYSVRDGNHRSKSRETVAGLLWQLTVDREDLEQRELVERMSQHIYTRKHVLACLEALVKSLGTQPKAHALPSGDDTCGWYSRLLALMNTYRDLDMHLP